MTNSVSAVRVIGVDVAKDKLDISDPAGVLAPVIRNCPATMSKLVAALKDAGEVLVVCEASGGYERLLVASLHAADIPVVVANPYQVRQFARGLGKLEKSDPIDAKVLQRFGEVVELHPTPPQSAEDQHLTAVIRRREQLIDMVSQERNRLETEGDTAIRALQQVTLDLFNSQLGKLNKEVEELLKNSPVFSPTAQILTSVPGVGAVTAATLICDLPELGHVNRKQICKLVGVAPLACDSATQRKRRSIYGGRANVRRVLYMAALSSVRRNPLMRKYYKHLIANGKPGKVVLVACMRKLLTILNSMVHNQKTWVCPITAGSTASTPGQTAESASGSPEMVMAGH